MIEVYRSLAEMAGNRQRLSGVAVGNFDGVHAGHRQLFRRAVDASHQHGWRPSVLTFDPHPSRVVAPDRAPKLLNVGDERWELMEAEGIAQVLVHPFDGSFAGLSPEEFARRVLVDGMHAGGVFVGENFRFGAKHAGDVELLKQLGRDMGFVVEVVPSVYVRGRMVSSTEIRKLLSEGKVSLACRLLERPYWVQGRVVTGEGIGSKQTVPTLNLQTESEVLPADGVYISQARDLEDGRGWDSITNVGVRPTFSGERRTIETFLLSPFDGKTPRRIRLAFLRRVREERKFESPEALKAQIMRDVGIAIRYHKRVSRLRRVEILP
ncbi:MAG TPA: bifunctional riboflavin kinase/FAD synthetase [Bryobacteraceae bacterium]|nr:bifunctional riboflavin kinase/FAD synthetase [Bryobacteraceae bacterium]